ncbi:MULTISPECIES: protease inhibitor [Streptomyces]|uniref:Probable subtilase-type protease inhibitor n=3 Tax=Streptomyces rochei group TaxID=2867164 RepID=A0AAX3ZUI2_STRRO|nr:MULTISPECIES: protease inhibitor [Streptomyces]WDI22305.1 protease inhibitor [Streptomyces enissocaesilis]KYK15087.1 protease inhibitor protein [Streptomyces sp. CC71]MBJ6622941.1 protease inhibitor [Streptomyces sp. DHE17-7]MBQ0878665.1 protease inhibitor [Streptomyces sp. RT42]MDI3098114.1 protease inhibitor [Streptomyces sp. AN-3]
MRNTARWAATLGLTATAVCGPLAGASLASPATAPASLYAPSALVLTVGYGESAATAAPVRAVTLTCAPQAAGTHPAAASACAELRGAGGDFDALRADPGVFCTREYDPVVVTVDGVWQGRHVSYERTFANECVKNAGSAGVFTF